MNVAEAVATRRSIRARAFSSTFTPCGYSAAKAGFFWYTRW